MMVGLMKAKVSSCSHSVSPPNTITTTPVMISMGGSRAAFEKRPANGESRPSP
jgi:hypothetical protein